MSPILMTKPRARKRKAGDYIPCAFVLFFIVSLSISHTSLAQRADSTAIDRKKLATLAIISGATYTVGMVGLHQLWYKDFSRRDFHFFNDNTEWNQVDKAGHVITSYYLSYSASRALLGCNVAPDKSDLIGAITGTLALLPIEIFDGYSEAYGASAGDLIANTTGSLFFLAQQKVWHEQRVIPRFSFRRTGYPSLRPAVLGDTRVSEILKDYNGQTYWLSIDIDKFIRFPKWLNLATGYGAQGMVFATNPENQLAGYSSYRQFYFSVDPDLTAIKTRSRVIKTLLFIGGMIKIPAPTLEISRGKVRLHALY